MGAVGVSDATELIDTCDKGADETEVDERDKVRIILGKAVRQESCEGPDKRKHADDEEYEDEVGRERIVFHEAMDKP